MFKRTLLILTLIASAFVSFAQDDFDRQLVTISKKLNDKILAYKKGRVMVANFTDLQGSTTELGRYLAEALSVELTNTDLDVVDRSGKDTLFKDRTAIGEGAVDSGSAELNYAKMVGVDYLIIGTTTLLDNSVDITVKALDIRKGVLVTGIRSHFPRTDAINNLLKSTIKSNGVGPANLNVARKIDTYEKSSVDDLFGARISELRKGECTATNRNNKIWYGQVCFENQTGEDILFYCTEANPEGWLSDYKVIIPNGGQNCSRLIAVNYDQNGVTENENRQATFRFYSIDERRRAIQPFIIDKCVVKSYVLTKKNLVLMKD